jgi:rhodanese-related sulfurtransferase
MYPPEKNAEIIVYCKAGSRGILAAVSLMQLGYTNVKNLEGGYDAFNPHQDPNAKPKSSGSCGG